MKKRNNVFLPTGNRNLSDLLSPDSSKDNNAGILIESEDVQKKGRDACEAPIILIEGDTGTGKTTLSLQIAHAAARINDARFSLETSVDGIQWTIFYYSLEQSANSIKRLSENFGFQSKLSNSDAEYYHDESSIEEHTKKDGKYENAKFRFCKFSHRPISTPEDKDVFEQRMNELTHALKKSKEMISPKNRVVFFIDCLNALSGRTLVRNDIYRLFQLFRVNNIPAVLTMEKASGIALKDSDLTALAAEFLSDIAIQLMRSSIEEYSFYYLEIVKSRVCRQVPGKHLYKIRTIAQSSGLPERQEEHGIVVFPSIYFVLSKSKAKFLQRQKNINTNLVEGNAKDFSDNLIIDDNNHELGLILNANEIKPNASIAIIGPNGTHKLALGLNFAMGRKVKDTKKSEKYANVLILNFGGSHYFNFKGIAWTKFNSAFRMLKISKSDDKYTANLWRDKYWISKYTGKDVDLTTQLNVTLLSFKIGQLTPEECFDVIERILTNEEDAGTKFTSVVICNSAELCTGFPLLKTDPLFLPSLLDLFDTHNLVTVSIGVENDVDKIIQETNFTLSARADYRMNLFHYPNIMELTKELIEKKDDKFKVKEQLIGLIIDNVSGKHYSRQPQWLYVDPIREHAKILYCVEDVNTARTRLEEIQEREKRNRKRRVKRPTSKNNNKSRR